MVKITHKLNEQLVNEIQILSDQAQIPLVKKATWYLETLAQTIDVMTEREVIKSLPLHTVYSFEKGDSQYVYCVAGSGVQYQTMLSLLDIAETFSNYIFIAQVNRQTFVNLYKIDKFEKASNARIKIVMKNGDIHIINRSFAKEFVEKFKRI